MRAALIVVEPAMGTYRAVAKMPLASGADVVIGRSRR
jgi:hypothetical protein